MNHMNAFRTRCALVLIVIVASPHALLGKPEGGCSPFISRHIAGDGLPPVTTLPSHMAESGIVTEPELKHVRQWMYGLLERTRNHDAGDAWMENWLRIVLPFEFHYGDSAFSKL